MEEDGKINQLAYLIGIITALKALNEICNVSDVRAFYSNKLFVIAKFGLQLKAKEESLFEGDGWEKIESKDDPIKRIEDFLAKNFFSF